MKYKREEGLNREMEEVPKYELYIFKMFWQEGGNMDFIFRA